ncbi:tRNA 2-thiouridine(34) synthase MnmA [candidate division CSSED10-310 bacterium]|uniref:tRNA-specific 2-thiouridylase MnmA n=1 Tax=candidate division CSSED10-310 bacterium TaxID=2855610 RepID=A0ABV6YX17_UNCC1
MSKNKKHVLVGMSGGVDSTVTAALLLKKDYFVTGVTMKIWDGKPGTFESTRNACYGPNEVQDIEETAKIARDLNIPFFVIDLVDEYKKCVLDYFQAEYLVGRTPNPCVVCNKKIKFSFLLEKARQRNIPFDYFATGHYARIEFDPVGQRYLLKKSIDRHKDQSYFLFALKQEQLQRTLFPLGSFTKKEVRQTAKEFGLSVHSKSESQDFFACRDYTVLFDEKSKPGPIIDDQGNIIGKHKGIMYYTIGQRKGVGVATGKPEHVINIDHEHNTVRVGPPEKLLASKLSVTQLNWISMVTLSQPLKVKAKIRQKHTAAEALVEADRHDRVLVTFEQPQKAITPGQMAVFYRDDEVVGGGTIEKVVP